MLHVEHVDRILREYKEARTKKAMHRGREVVVPSLSLCVYCRIIWVSKVGCWLRIADLVKFHSSFAVINCGWRRGLSH